MPRINPQLAEKGVAFTADDVVTAFFPPGSDALRITQELAQAGIPDDKVFIFAGEAGAARLDTHDQDQSLWARFWRAFERGTADESVFMDRADQVLRDGGTLVAVFTDDDDDRKDAAIRVLKQYQGQNLVHWGRWTFEEIV